MLSTTTIYYIPCCLQPLTSFLSGIECMNEVVSSWKPALCGTPSSACNCTPMSSLHRETHTLTPAQAQTQTPAVDNCAKAVENLATLRNCLQSMESTNSFMTMTINRCIDYTKASKGVKLVPRPETVQLQACMQMPVNLMRNVQSAAVITLCDPAADLCSHVITDKQWLMENLLCLLSNAVKYSHMGAVEVGVKLEKGSSAVGGAHEVADMLRFEVQDTGVGLSAEARATLFNPFKQAQRLAGGTGLGLFSLAKRVEALQGRYGVQERSDGLQGSLFWFSIPYRPDQQSARLLLLDLRSASDCSSHTSPRGECIEKVYEHVLVVDDAPLIVKMTSMLLKRKGHQVEHAVNGAEALDMMLQVYQKRLVGQLPTAGQQSGAAAGASHREGQSPYDVVLLDLQMPVLDGIETLRRLRAVELQYLTQHSMCSGDNDPEALPLIERTDSVVLCDNAPCTLSQQQKLQPHSAQYRPYHQLVIALSANSDDETTQAALLAGADAFMAKPFTYENFTKVLQQLAVIS